MSDPTGFTDIRIGHGAQGVGDDSVWPSFTDIMTVIVMIFLMALVVIMVRNFELDRQLISTISDKEQASLMSEGLARQNIKLEGFLSETTTERDKLRQELEQELARISALSADQAKLEDELGNLVLLRQRLESANTSLSDEKKAALKKISELTASEQAAMQEIEDLAAREQTAIREIEDLAVREQSAIREIEDLTVSELAAQSEIEGLIASEQSLTDRISQLSDQLATLQLQSSEEIFALTENKRTLGEKLDTVSLQLGEIKLLLRGTRLENRDLSEEISELARQSIEQGEQYSIAAEQIEALKELIRVRDAENSALQARADSSASEFISLQEEYESLDEKYRDLIRPARSTAGKQVVRVYIEKAATGLQYRIRGPEQPEPVYVSKPQLDDALAQLKQQYSKTLYVKIIIREDSELSHNEAWDFTQEIHQKYDYYFQ
jgi:chromosome segregation ATPase